MSDDILTRLADEADQCRNDGADDIAKLLDDARGEIERLRVALGHVAAIAHNGGAMQLDEHGALCAVRRLTLPHWGRDGDRITARSRVLAAILASRAAGDQSAG